MARKKESPQKAAIREMMCSDLKDNDIRIKNETDVNAVIRDMMSFTATITVPLFRMETCHFFTGNAFLTALFICTSRSLQPYHNPAEKTRKFFLISNIPRLRHPPYLV